METRSIINPRAPRRDADGRYEFLKPGNTYGDDGNWGLLIVGDNWHVQVRISGVWQDSWDFPRPK